jgi:hypothetical protein
MQGKRTSPTQYFSPQVIRKAIAGLSVLLEVDGELNTSSYFCIPVFFSEESRNCRHD